MGVAIFVQVKLLNRAEARDWLLVGRPKRLESKIQEERRNIESCGPNKQDRASLIRVLDG